MCSPYPSLQPPPGQVPTAPRLGLTPPLGPRVPYLPHQPLSWPCLPVHCPPGPALEAQGNSYPAPSQKSWDGQGSERKCQSPGSREEL